MGEICARHGVLVMRQEPRQLGAMTGTAGRCPPWLLLVRPAGRTQCEVKDLYTPQRAVLAEGKGVACDCESEGSRRQSTGLTNRNRIGGDALGSGGRNSQSPKPARNDAAYIRQP